MICDKIYLYLSIEIVIDDTFLTENNFLHFHITEIKLVEQKYH